MTSPLSTLSPSRRSVFILLTTPLAVLVTTCRLNCGSLATTSPSQIEVCCQGRRIPATTNPSKSTAVILARSLANQLERTKCMAGKRWPRPLVGRSRTIRRWIGAFKLAETVRALEAVGSVIGIFLFLCLCSSKSMMIVGLVRRQIQKPIALPNNLFVMRRYQQSPRLISVAETLPNLGSHLGWEPIEHTVNQQ